ncbi:hypothetical protein C0992_004528 [Termitomyces sp. T32_za158]|nr:hypothetical protein C0992_004528 [Termitomyces sp. T32_za158]
MQGRLDQPITIDNDEKWILPTDADFSNFSDSQAEGPFSTTASRCVADAYIQDQIKGHEKIIRYYNRCHNALTIACRFPPEILSAIFSEVVQCFDSQATSSDYFPKIRYLDWIKSVSHVCSHWREVALNVPELWSNIPLYNPRWAREMVRRSDPMPMTIRYEGPTSVTKNERCTRSFQLLIGILRFFLPRIKSLTLDSRKTSGRFLSYQTSRESINILSLLNNPASMMERLEVRLLTKTDNNKLPNEFIAMSSQLRHLTLEDCGIVWDPKRIELVNLRSLKLVNLRRETNPSLYQLLTILRQTSRLESLNLEMRDQETGLGDSSLQPGVDPVPLRHLRRITLTGGLSYCVLLNHIIFSKNARLIHLNIQDQSEILRPLAALAEKFDNGIEDPTVSLNLSRHSIRCWKSKDTTNIPSLHDPPTIHIGSFNTKMDILRRHLRLNQLISLTVDILLEQDSWTFFATLPQLRDICVRSFQNEFLNALHRGLVKKLTADVQPFHMTFPALRNLSMVEWYFFEADSSEHDALAPYLDPVQQMLSCFELRKKAGLPLECLRLDECSGVNDLQLEHLQVVIDQVKYTEWEADDDDSYYEETSRDFDPIDFYDD